MGSEAGTETVTNFCDLLSLLQPQFFDENTRSWPKAHPTILS